jgi:hypothetical protein
MDPITIPVLSGSNPYEKVTGDPQLEQKVRSAACESLSDCSVDEAVNLRAYVGT